jgi:hypothetical protein
MSVLNLAYLTAHHSHCVQLDRDLGRGLQWGSFLNYHEEFSSMLVATGFAVAVIAYLFALYLSLVQRPLGSAS